MYATAPPPTARPARVAILLSLLKPGMITYNQTEKESLNVPLKQQLFICPQPEQSLYISQSANSCKVVLVALFTF